MRNSAWEVDAVGVDTARFRWRDPGIYGAVREVAHNMGAGGQVWGEAPGFRFGAHPAGSAWAEARIAEMLHGPDAHYLANRDQVGDAAMLCAEWFNDHGIRLPAQPAVARLDVAGQVAFGEPADGRLMLDALSGLDLPWLKRGTEGGKGGRLQTVHWRYSTGRSIQLRGYDKSTEAGIGEPCELVRVERQNRARKRSERWLSTVLAEPLGRWFERRYLETMLAAADRHVVVHRADIVPTLAQLLDDGTIKPDEYLRLVGFVAVDGRGCGRTSTYKYLARLRALGIHLAAGGPPVKGSALPDQLRALRTALAAA